MFDELEEERSEYVMSVKIEVSANSRVEVCSVELGCGSRRVRMEGEIVL